MLDWTWCHWLPLKHVTILWIDLLRNRPIHRIVAGFATSCHCDVLDHSPPVCFHVGWLPFLSVTERNHLCTFQPDFNWTKCFVLPKSTYVVLDLFTLLKSCLKHMGLSIKYILCYENHELYWKSNNTRTWRYQDIQYFIFTMFQQIKLKYDVCHLHLETNKTKYWRS